VLCDCVLIHIGEAGDHGGAAAELLRAVIERTHAVPFGGAALTDAEVNCLAYTVIYL
jgi:hypothetical protein